MMRVYVSGAITHGDPKANALIAIEYADVLLEMGFAPYLPHLDVFWNDVSSHEYEDWMKLDFAWIEVCNAVLRIPGFSPGGDREVVFATGLGIPVFYTIEDLIYHFAGRRGKCN